MNHMPQISFCNCYINYQELIENSGKVMSKDCRWLVPRYTLKMQGLFISIQQLKNDFSAYGLSSLTNNGFKHF